MKFFSSQTIANSNYPITQNKMFIMPIRNLVNKESYRGIN